jgi:hypothetical protein
MKLRLGRSIKIPEKATIPMLRATDTKGQVSIPKLKLAM